MQYISARERYLSVRTIEYDFFDFLSHFHVSNALAELESLIYISKCSLTDFDQGGSICTLLPVLFVGI
jgi:hypothetical protein